MKSVFAGPAARVEYRSSEHTFGCQANDCWLRLARHARVVICGAISQYNSTDGMRGPSNYMSLLVNHASMTGFVVTDYMSRYLEGLSDMSEWLQSGRLKTREDIVKGIESFPDALGMLFSGENHGKLVLQVGDAHPARPEARRGQIAEAVEERDSVAEP